MHEPKPIGFKYRRLTILFCLAAFIPGLMTGPVLRLASILSEKGGDCGWLFSAGAVVSLLLIVLMIGRIENLTSRLLEVQRELMQMQGKKTDSE